MYLSYVFSIATECKVFADIHFFYRQLVALLFWAPVIYDYLSERFLDPPESPMKSQERDAKTVYLEPLKGEDPDNSS